MCTMRKMAAPQENATKKARGSTQIRGRLRPPHLQRTLVENQQTNRGDPSRSARGGYFTCRLGVPTERGRGALHVGRMPKDRSIGEFVRHGLTNESAVGGFVGQGLTNESAVGGFVGQGLTNESAMGEFVEQGLANGSTMGEFVRGEPPLERRINTLELMLGLRR